MKKALVPLLLIFLQISPVFAEKSDISRIIKLLGHDDYKVRAQARQKLKYIGASAVPLLIHSLDKSKSIYSSS